MRALTRREAMRALGAAGALAALRGIPAARAQPAGTPAPRRGGRIVVATQSSSTADTLDPAKGALSTDYARHNLFYSGLTQYDASLNAVLALAETIESDDKTSWRIVLRRGVEFHDGRPLTAADVVYSLARHKLPETASKVASIAQQFAGIVANGTHELTLTLAGANSDLPVVLADPHFLIVPDGTTDFSKAIGTGPYRLGVFKPGVRTIAVRNPNYWKGDGRPWLDEVELIGMPDEPSRVNALLAGDVHLINAVNPRSTRRIEASPDHRVLAAESGMYTDLIMRRDMQPTASADFVLAIQYLLDRETIKRALFRNLAVIGNDQPIPPSHRYHFAGLPQRPFDPERARFHLQRAGLLGTRLPMYATPAATGSVDMASILQESAARIGLRLAVNRVPADGYWSHHWMKHPLGFGNTNARPTADMAFSQLFKSDSPWNVSGWRNEKFDQLVVAARGERDEATRRQMYADMQVMVHEHCGVGVPVFINLVDGYDRRIQGYGAIPTGGLMGYCFADHVWMES